MCETKTFCMLQRLSSDSVLCNDEELCSFSLTVIFIELHLMDLPLLEHEKWFCIYIEFCFTKSLLWHVFFWCYKPHGLEWIITYCTVFWCMPKSWTTEFTFLENTWYYCKITTCDCGVLWLFNGTPVFSLVNHSLIVCMCSSKLTQGYLWELNYEMNKLWS